MIISITWCVYWLLCYQQPLHMLQASSLTPWNLKRERERFLTHLTLFSCKDIIQGLSSSHYPEFSEKKLTKTKLRGFYSASELYRPSDRRLSAKLIPTFCAWSAQRIPTAVNLGFLDRSRYFSIQVATQLSSRGWVDPVPDPLLLRKSGSAGNRTWICSQKLWPLDQRRSISEKRYL
jgi:hypothetical protein